MTEPMFDAANSPLLDTGAVAQVTMLERLSAVHSVLGIERQATEHDIMISTLLEALRLGPATDVDLLVEARRVWPGAGITAARLDRAVAIAHRIGYLVPVANASEATWSLSRLGVSELEGSRDWARDIIDSTAETLQGKVAEAGVTLTQEAAKVWTHHLEHALHASIRQSFAAYQGDVQRHNDWWLTPRTFDHDALVSTIRVSVVDESYANLIEALAFEAIDPLSPFGSDLVTHITIGYMLHAFMARRDNLGVRVAIGSLRKDRAILDTPVLLKLLDIEELRRPIERAIGAALQVGMDVIAPEHYLEELNGLLARNERENVPAVQNALDGGIEAAVLAPVVEDQVIALWLRGMARGVYTTWAELRAAAGQLDGALRALGVTVRQHGNKPADEVEEFEASLRVEAKHRGAQQVTRDANTMAMARRARQRIEEQRPFWPGAWVITSDLHMAPAYKRLFPADPFGLTLTPGRWVGLVSSCSSPATVEDLAQSSAALLAEDSFLAIAARYPVKTAIGMAQALGPLSGGSQLDLRLTHMSPNDLISEQPDFMDDADEVGARVTAAVIARRAARLNASFEAGAARLRVRADEAGVEARMATTRLASEVGEKLRLTEERDQARKEIDELRTEQGRELQRQARRFVARAGYMVGGVLSVAALMQREVVWVFLALVGLVVFWRTVVDWQSDLSKPYRALLPAALLELLGLTFGVLSVLNI